MSALRLNQLSHLVRFRHRIEVTSSVGRRDEREEENAIAIDRVCCGIVTRTFREGTGKISKTERSGSYNWFVAKTRVNYLPTSQVTHSITVESSRYVIPRGNYRAIIVVRVKLYESKAHFLRHGSHEIFVVHKPRLRFNCY